MSAPQPPQPGQPWQGGAPVPPPYEQPWQAQQHGQQGEPAQHPAAPQQAMPPQQGEQRPALQEAAKDLADGEWHRMHPLTPLLRGGIAFIVLIGVMLTWWRDRIINIFVPDQYEYYDQEGDPISWLIDSGYLWLALIGFTAIVLLFVIGFYLSWRKRTFRITGDVVELREGILNRKHRQAPLARIQGIEVQKPLIARMLGCAKLDIEQAGTEGNVDLAFINAKVATALRAEILMRASGRSREESGRGGPGAQTAGHAVGQPGAASAGLSGRVGSLAEDFRRPDADLDQEEHTLFRLSTGRLIASSVLSTASWMVLIVVLALIVIVPAGLFSDEGLIGLVIVALSMLPALLAAAIGIISRVMSLLRFRVAKTRDGIRLTRGMASITSQTVPPGRVFSLSISQPLLWRPFGWWAIRYGRATPPSGSSSGNSNNQALGMTLLPVGNRDDVFSVLSLVLSEEDARYIVDVGLYGGGAEGDGFIVSPPRARAFRWFSWRRNGIHGRDSMFVLRKGAIWRSAEILPTSRVQSVGMSQGPVYGMAGLARLQLHTVGTLSSKSIGALDAGDVTRVFAHANPTVQQAMVSDTTERWGQIGTPDVVAGAAGDGHDAEQAAAWQPGGLRGDAGQPFDGRPGSQQPQTDGRWAHPGGAADEDLPPPSPAYGQDWSRG